MNNRANLVGWSARFAARLLVLAVAVPAFACSAEKLDLPKLHPDKAFRTVGKRVTRVIERGEGFDNNGIMVHGLWADAGGFEALLDELEAPLHLLAPDLPGFGLTQRRDIDRYDLDEQARWMVGFMQSQNIGAATWIGSDRGAAVALRVAQLYPAAVQRLVLIGPEVFSASDTLQQSMASSFGGCMAPFFSQGLVESRLRRAWYNDALVTDELIAAHAAGINEDYGKLALADYSSDNPAELIEATVAPDLGRINVPVLIIRGEFDRMTTFIDAERLATALPKAEVITAPGVGHLPHEEKPITTARIIRTWLEENPAAMPEAFTSPTVVLDVDYVDEEITEEEPEEEVEPETPETYLPFPGLEKDATGSDDGQTAEAAKLPPGF